MDILTKWEKAGHSWGIKGVEPSREQKVSGRWVSVEMISRVLEVIYFG